MFEKTVWQTTDLFRKSVAAAKKTYTSLSLGELECGNATPIDREELNNLIRIEKIMIIFARIAAVAAAASLLAACGTSHVANLPVKGGAFNKSLHSEYIKLANSEYDQTDFESGGAYAERAKLAAMGKPTAPDGIHGRKLTKIHKGNLTEARAPYVGTGQRGGQKSTCPCREGTDQFRLLA
ncbi:MAG: hypothetical protein CMM52_15695 [Rhodospirillaceae bacterium]|nr:hypothetical protein [Rhodospirillaceae bacterium]